MLLLLLYSIPTPSFGLTFVVRPVLDPHLCAYPFRTPSLPFFVVIAPLVWDALGG